MLYNPYDLRVVYFTLPQRPGHHDKKSSDIALTGALDKFNLFHINLLQPHVYKDIIIITTETFCPMV